MTAILQKIFQGEECWRGVRGRFRVQDSELNHQNNSLCRFQGSTGNGDDSHLSTHEPLGVNIWKGKQTGLGWWKTNQNNLQWDRGEGRGQTHFPCVAGTGAGERDGLQKMTCFICWVPEQLKNTFWAFCPTGIPAQVLKNKQTNEQDFH